MCFERVDRLSRLAAAIRHSVNRSGYPAVDHIELYQDRPGTGVDSRNFVLCPGLEFDRSPCGTGTSAKLACLAADGRLEPHATWTQQGILGTTFQAHYRWTDRNQQRIEPTVTGTAFVTAETRLLFDPSDPFRHGLTTESAAAGKQGRAGE